MWWARAYNNWATPAQAMQQAVTPAQAMQKADIHLQQQHHTVTMQEKNTLEAVDTAMVRVRKNVCNKYGLIAEASIPLAEFY